MRKGNTPLHELKPKHGINPGISYAPEFAEYEACVAAGLDLWRWEQNEYPIWMKAKVMAWHEGHKLVQLHTEDVATDIAIRRSKQKRR